MTENTYIEEDHINEQHVIWNFNSEDHVDRRYVTRIITAEDHDDRYHVTDTIVTQQQPEDLRPIGELNLTNRQNHRMIDIEELLND